VNVARTSTKTGRRRLGELRDTHHGDPKAFRSYCELILDLREEQKLQDDFVAMAIAHAMFIPDLDKDPLSEEITTIAGELESPASPAKQAQLWAALEKAVEELPAR
jgi:hypothetical protein